MNIEINIQHFLLCLGLCCYLAVGCNNDHEHFISRIIKFVTGHSVDINPINSDLNHRKHEFDPLGRWLDLRNRFLFENLIHLLFEMSMNSVIWSIFCLPTLKNIHQKNEKFIRTQKWISNSVNNLNGKSSPWLGLKWWFRRRKKKTNFNEQKFHWVPSIGHGYWMVCQQLVLAYA